LNEHVLILFKDEHFLHTDLFQIIALNLKFFETLIPLRFVVVGSMKQILTRACDVAFQLLFVCNC